MPTPVPVPDTFSWSQSYSALLALISARVSAETGPLYSTDSAGLDQLYLSHLPVERRQISTCDACKRFLETYGGLVTIDARGRSHALLWDASAAPEGYRDAIGALQRAVNQSAVTGVALLPESTWGKPVTGPWRHLSATPPAALIHRPGVLRNSRQEAAQKREDHAMLGRGLDAFPLELVQRAHTLLTHGKLYRSEACIGVAAWLRDLHQSIREVRGQQARDNLLWRAVATAPPGYCHVRSTMIGTLLEDLAADLPFDEIKARFDAKMHPLLYLRPQAPPRAGNVAEAEKIIAALGLEASLKRRFARLDDVVALWQPPQQARVGVFGHLVTRERAREPLDVPATPITWEKFARTVLPTANRVELYTRDKPDAYAALVTAQDPAAPPILQWDTPARRNPVSSYVYHGGSPPAAWNLPPNAWVEVTAITLSPHLWHAAPDQHSHKGKGLFLLLSGAWDTRHTSSGGFFPESLKSDLHPIRATLEAYAKAATIADREQATACGLSLHGTGPWDALVRVTVGDVRTQYTLDRWD